MAVDRCVCHAVSFAELIGLARSLTGGPPVIDSEAMLRDLAERTRCGTGCGACRPYIRLALLTGDARLRPMTTAVLHARIAEAESRAGQLPPA